MGVDVDVHGFRSAFKTWASEQTAYPRELIEVALAHSLGPLDEAYRHGEQQCKRGEHREQEADIGANPGQNGLGRTTSKETSHEAQIAGAASGR